MIVEFLSNKRKVKRLAKGLLSMMLSLIIGLSSLAIIPYVSPTAEAATQYTSGYYTYERLDSVHAKIVDVDSNISGAVTIPETLDGYTVSVIGDYAFAWLREITRVTVPSGVTSINSGAFNGCSKLNYISLPDSLMYIKDWAFQNCDALTSVTIPDNVLSLGNKVFYGCDSLSKVTFGAKVSVLGNYIFEGCPKLSSFSVSSSNSYLKVSNGALINGYKLVAYPPAKATTNYTLPSGITSVERGAFSGCKNLKTVSVSNNVVEISYYAFEDCTNLTSVSLPQNVKTIKGGAFRNCSSLKTIDTSKVQYLGYSAFESCSSLASVNISNISHWDYSVFSRCTSITSISIPNKVSEIPSWAFYGCSSLKTITVPNTIKSVGSSAFYNCTSLSSFSLPTGITEIGSSAFADTAYYNNSSNWSNNGLLYKGNYLLSGDNATGAVTIKDGCVLISGGSFNSNKSITSVKVSDSVKYIGASAFSRCTELTYIELGEQVASVGNYAFSNCAKLTNVKFNDKVTQIGEYAFAWSEKIEDVALPSSVTTIAYGMFQGCTNLKNVHISNSVKKIDSCAFRDCDNLKKVYYFGTYEDKLSTLKIDSYNNNCFKNASFEYAHNPNHVVDNFANEYDSYPYSSSYLPLDGTNGTKDFCVPGQADNMIPQGLAHYKDDAKGINWILVSAYHKAYDGEITRPSAIYALDFETGDFVAQFNLYKVGGEVCDAHVGGVAVSNNNLYITYLSYNYGQIAYVPLSELDVPTGTIKDIKLADKVILPELNETSAAYVNVSEDILWAGNFYSYNGGIFVEDSWGIPASFKNNSLLLGYELSGSDSKTEWNNFKKMNNPNNQSWSSYRINIPNSIECIQGATVKKLPSGKYRLFLSRTTNASFAASISITDISLNKSVINLKQSDFVEIANLPGAENIIEIDGYIYSVYESAALSYRGDAFWKDWLKSVTDVIWRVDIDTILSSRESVSWFNCPIDIEVYDDTGKLIGRTVDNVVDETVTDEQSNVIIRVVDETKYLWTPSDKNYTVKIVGNGEGTMDYSVMQFDPELNETVRTNFFDVEISDGLVLTGNLKIADENFDLSEYNLTTDSMVISASESFNNAGKTVSINISGTTGGETDKSFDTVSGDYISVFAIPNEGYVLEGWYENDVLVSTDTEYSFVAKNDRSLVAKFEKFVIKNPSTTTINYGDSIILHAGIDGTLPAGTYIEWTVSNGNFAYSVSEDGTTCTLSPSASGSTVFTATIYDSEGNELATDEQEMTSNAGFFQKIIAFFKILFGLTKTIPQVYKGIF